MHATGDKSASRAATFLYILFFLSGFAGLVYEVLWTRRFGLSFGNTIYAATVVLSAFMGGLALGSRTLGALADRLERRVPALTLYGWMEIGVGAYCLGFERLLAAQDSLLLGLYRAYDPGPTTTLALKFGLAFLILIVPATLMGGTLPVLIKQLSRKLERVGAVTGRLYFVNCLGAVIGTLAVAFWMIPHLGLALSNASAAGINILVGVGALGLRGRFETAEDPEALPAALPAAAPEVPRAVLRWALVGIFVSGFTAMLYQVAWIRLLSLVLGGSTYSFSLIVAAFITGIALGSLIVARLMPRIESPARLFALCQTAIGLSVLALLPVYSRLPLFFIASRGFMNPGYEAHELFKYAVSLGVMLVPTTLFGMGFPLVSRMAAGSLERLAGRVGGVYALNTAGNILGAALCGLALLPWLGLKYSLEAGIILNLASGAAILLALGESYRVLARRTLAVSVAGLGLYLLFAPGWDRLLLTAGAYRIHAEGGAAGASLESGREREMLFYREGPAAVVTVERHDSLVTLRVNGKPDASTGLDMPTQLLLAHLPMLLHPKPRSVLVIGVGSGVTCGGALAHRRLESLTCVEISPGVLAGSRLFARWNRSYWEDPRVRLVLDDGRDFVFRSPQKFDIITSEPSNPWIAGIGNLYTTEFYRACSERLAPGGLVCQWIHLYEMEETVLKTILRTFLDVFPQAVAFNSVENNDLLLIGPTAPLSECLDSLEARSSVPGVRQDLESIGLVRPFVLLTTQVFDDAGLRSWTGIGPLNTDNFPQVEYQAPRGFFNAERVGLPEENRLARAGHTLLRDWLRSHSSGVEDYLALARYQERSGYTGLMYSALQDALRLEPDNPEALELLARMLTGRQKYAEAQEAIQRIETGGKLTEPELLELEFPVALALDERSTASFVNPPDFTRSLRIKSRLAGLEPTRSLHRFELGDIYSRLGDFERAENEFRAALELRAADSDSAAPDMKIILNRAGQAALTAQAFDRATLWYARYCTEFPDDPLGPALLKMVVMERLLSRGGAVSADSLRRALGE